MAKSSIQIKGLSIRKASDKDLQKITRLKAEFLGTPLRKKNVDFLPRRLVDKMDTVFVAELDGKLAGFVWTGMFYDNTGELQGIGVRKKFRGKEIGGALQARAIEHLAEQGYKYIGSYPTTIEGKRLLMKITQKRLKNPMTNRKMPGQHFWRAKRPARRR